MLILVENTKESFSCSPFPNVNVKNLLIAVDNDPVNRENIETTPATTL